MGIENEPGGVTITLPHGISRLVAATRYALGSPARAGATLLLAAVAYALVVLSSFPGYTAQMAAQLRLPTAVVALSRNLLATAGVLGLLLTVLYAGLAGVTATVGYAAVRTSRERGAGSTGGLLAGLFAASCGSCGAGLLGALGFTGVVVAFPFDGNLLRLAGVLLLTYFLAGTGTPGVCERG